MKPNTFVRLVYRGGDTLTLWHPRPLEHAQTASTPRPLRAVQVVDVDDKQKGARDA